MSSYMDIQEGLHR